VLPVQAIVQARGPCVRLVDPVVALARMPLGEPVPVLGAAVEQIPIDDIVVREKGERPPPRADRDLAHGSPDRGGGAPRISGPDERPRDGRRLPQAPLPARREAAPELRDVGRDVVDPVEARGQAAGSRARPAGPLPERGGVSRAVTRVRPAGPSVSGWADARPDPTGWSATIHRAHGRDRSVGPKPYSSSRRPLKISAKRSAYLMNAAWTSGSKCATCVRLSPLDRISTTFA
jgi:hypothetical protein